MFIQALLAGVAGVAAPGVMLRDVGAPYQTVTLEIDGEQLDQSQGSNPFADYRLDVTFSHGETSYTVPGYFAACGRAADNGCTRGRRWRAKFVPPTAGAWSYRIAFRKGTDIVASGEPGVPASLADGTVGRFTVKAGSVSAAEARGLLRYTGEPYYRWSGSGHLSFKLGLDSPENMLAYADFDGTPNAKGFRKTWAPHVRDYDRASVRFTWRGGKGKGLLGRLRFARETGLTGVSMLLFNVGGDDQNVVPHILKVSAQTYAKLTPHAQWNEGVFHDRYHVAKLEQWQRVLSYGNSLGLRLHFKLGETENDHFMDGGALGRERKIYLREMLARFNFARAAIWNVGEENVQNSADLKQVTAYIDQLDPYDHPIVMHTYPQQKERYRSLLGAGSALTGASLQGGTKDYADMRPDIVKWRAASRFANRQWVIGYDEFGGAAAGTPIDTGFPLDELALKGVESLGALDVPAEVVAAMTATGPSPETAPTRETFRRRALWNALTAGGEGLEIYYGWTNRCHDLGCENDRTRALKFADGVKALRFFDEYVGERALTMTPDDELTPDKSDFVFADHGKTYVIYTVMQQQQTFLALFGQQGRYSVDWYDPVHGGPLQKGSVAFLQGGEARAGFAGHSSYGSASLGTAPTTGSGEWAILVRRADNQSWSEVSKEE